MKHFKTSLFYLITAGALIIGCKGEEGDPAPLLTGDITGYATLLNTASRSLLDKSGITVRAEGTNPLISTTTDAAGRFELKNIPAGTYLLVYEKTGYGTHKRTAIHQGGTFPSFQGTITLGQTSTVKVTDGSLSFPNPGNPPALQMQGNYDAPMQGTVRLRMYFSTDPNVSAENYLSSSLFLHSASGTAITLNFTGYPSPSTFADIVSGTRVYVRVCLANNESPYNDPDTGLLIFPANGPLSETLSYIIP